MGGLGPPPGRLPSLHLARSIHQLGGCYPPEAWPASSRALWALAGSWSLPAPSDLSGGPGRLWPALARLPRYHRPVALSCACRAGQGDMWPMGRSTRAAWSCNRHPSYSKEPAPRGPLLRPPQRMRAEDRSRGHARPRGLSQLRCFAFLGLRRRRLFFLLYIPPITQ
jgi:hypothetical protein